MQFHYFGVIVFLLYLYTCSCNDIESNILSSDERTVSNAAPSRRSIITSAIGQIIDIPLSFIPGFLKPGGRQHDLWDLVGSFQSCELRCTGRLCSCCQRHNLVFVKSNLCMHSFVKPSKNLVEISMSAMNVKLLRFPLSIKRFKKVCDPVSSTLLKLMNAKLCIYPQLEEYEENGFTFCVSAEFIMQDIKVFQINFDCINVNGDITIYGKPVNDDNKVLAALRVVSPLKFIELLKRLVLGY